MTIDFVISRLLSQNRSREAQIFKKEGLILEIYSLQVAIHFHNHFIR